MVALRDSSKGLEGSKALEIADEIEIIILRIDRKVKEWASWPHVKSFLQQKDIKEGIARLHKDIDAAMMKFSIQMNMEMTRNQMESKAIQERDKAEIREVLQIIVKSTDDMKAILNMQSVDSRPVEQMMQSLQTELMDPYLQPKEEEVFKAGLWELHEKTSKLPPLTDLTGQVTLSSHTTVAKGLYNDIYQGQWLDREPVALRLPRALANNPDTQDRLQREVTIWRELNHPNVVPLYGVIYIDEDIYTVSPWMDNGTALAYLKKYPTADRLKILIDAASGLEYLHNRGIVHGDLRGANILISRTGVARLSDFGLSQFLEDRGQGMTSTQNINPRWFAPELLQNAPVSTHSDVWSFGMVCLELLSGDVPYSSITRDIAVLRELDNGKLPEHPGRDKALQGLSDEMWELMKTCWTKRPQSRPSIVSIKAQLIEIKGRMVSDDSKVNLSKRWIKFTSSAARNNSSRPSTGDHNGRRPSTASSVMTTMSSISSQRAPTNFNEYQNQDELSPLVSSPSRRFFKRHTEPVQPRKNSSSSTSSSSSSNPIVKIDFDPPSSPTSPRSESRIFGEISSPRLELPLVSSSLPVNMGSHFRPIERSKSHDITSPVKSVRSSNSSIHITGPLREAVLDPRIIVDEDNGVVVSGTLEGLVDRLIGANFKSSRTDVEYQDVLLTACADFTTPEDLFALLSRRFYDAELQTKEHPEDRVAIQYNIFMVMTYWISHKHLQIDHQLLWQMRNFCETAIRTKSSTTMVNKASDLLALVVARSKKDNSTPSILVPGRKLLSASQIKPLDLAIALTLLEGDKYKVLVPSDYIAQLRRHPGYNNVEGVYTTNNKIILWVKDSILHFETAQDRASVLKFFIHTATECRKLRNFGSLVAIAIALHSNPIERLRLTKAELTPQMQAKLDSLGDIINPDGNHRAYREALNEATNPEEKGCCIPWLAVHLKELHLVLQKYPPTLSGTDGKPLINFQRYVKFMAHVREAISYKPPDLERYRLQGQLDYLENQLRNLRLSDNPDEELMARSRKYETQETIDYRTRKPQLKTLGFKTS
ncbi:Serine/threonine-protein kinase STY17 [Psilocybe cubensis]|nr:Serine/threonine-protein kinase STY17 [Psilocybe cubensis]KAH9483782.1 Serine/threonine-protein kinase STY17 [Psilocybe cubensis]